MRRRHCCLRRHSPLVMAAVAVAVAVVMELAELVDLLIWPLSARAWLRFGAPASLARSQQQQEKQPHAVPLAVVWAARRVATCLPTETVSCATPSLVLLSGTQRRRV